MKKIEKIGGFEFNTDGLAPEALVNFEILRHKINEIIEKLNSLLNEG